MKSIGEHDPAVLCGVQPLGMPDATSSGCVSAGTCGFPDANKRGMPRLFALMVLVLATIGVPARHAGARSAAQLASESRAALNRLYATTPAAKALGGRAKGILVFPRIVKAGFMVGAQGGNGTLFRGGKAVGYYNNVAASYGFQAGVQAFSYVLFLMSNDAVSYLDRTGGWELGTGPSLVVIDKGMAKSMTTTTLKDDVYAFIFGQKGLMGGIGIQGSKITRYHPD
jgi:lipid-binding SYLF domain-containing protein